MKLSNTAVALLAVIAVGCAGGSDEAEIAPTTSADEPTTTSTLPAPSETCGDAFIIATRVGPSAEPDLGPPSRLCESVEAWITAGESVGAFAEGLDPLALLLRECMSNQFAHELCRRSELPDIYPEPRPLRINLELCWAGDNVIHQLQTGQGIDDASTRRALGELRRLRSSNRADRDAYYDVQDGVDTVLDGSMSVGSSLLIQACGNAGFQGEEPPPPPSTTTTTTTLPPPPPNPPTMSLAEFNAIQSGMSYEQVVAIVGGQGQVMAQTDLAGYSTIIYMWDGEGMLGANANVMFQNGAMISKAQFGLS